MNEYLKVKDHPNLLRDTKSYAVLDVDDNALYKYKKERERIFEMNKSMEENKKLKTDVEELKKMVQMLMENQ